MAKDGEKPFIMTYAGEGDVVFPEEIMAPFFEVLAMLPLLHLGLPVGYSLRGKSEAGYPTAYGLPGRYENGHVVPDFSPRPAKDPLSLSLRVRQHSRRVFGWTPFRFAPLEGQVETHLPPATHGSSYEGRFAGRIVDDAAVRHLDSILSKYPVEEELRTADSSHEPTN